MEYDSIEAEYNVTYEYGGIAKKQTIYLNADSTETSMISGDYYKNYTVDDSVVYSISKEDATFFEAKYLFENDQIVKVIYNDNEDIAYTYNESNQITSISKGGNKISEYEYNLIGQLIAVYNHTNKTVEKYSYDMYNNIKSVDVYEYDGELGELINTDSYGDESDVNTDRVTSFNGVSISYDEIGNPLTYYDGKEFSWTGRILDSIKTDDEDIEYAYDMNGLRVQKNVDGVVTNYYHDGEDIIVEASDEHTIWYIYDETTNVLGLTYQRDKIVGNNSM